MQIRSIFAKFLLAAAAPAVMIAGPSCGMTVTGKVTLDADLQCTNTDGLIVGADNTTVDLNGHTISCTAAGYLGSCQGLSFSGVSASGRKNVVVKGPGKIKGFAFGVNLATAPGAMVRDLEITGPPSPGYGSNLRQLALGIFLQSTVCPPNNATTANIQGNTVSNQVVGIVLASSSCAKVTHNYTFDNNSDDFKESRGILLSESSNNLLDSNSATRNGGDYAGEGGIALLGPQAVGNTVTNNISVNNCGDGITLSNANPGGNVVKSNVLRGNGGSSLNGQCAPPQPGLFFDLAERFGASGNTYNKNNQCDTQLGSMPAGICNPGE